MAFYNGHALRDRSVAQDREHAAQQRPQSREAIRTGNDRRRRQPARRGDRPIVRPDQFRAPAVRRRGVRQRVPGLPGRAHGGQAAAAQPGRFAHGVEHLHGVLSNGAAARLRLRPPVAAGSLGPGPGRRSPGDPRDRGSRPADQDHRTGRDFPTCDAPDPLAARRSHPFARRAVRGVVGHSAPGPGLVCAHGRIVRHEDAQEPYVPVCGEQPRQPGGPAGLPRRDRTGPYPARPGVGVDHRLRPLRRPGRCGWTSARPQPLEGPGRQRRRRRADHLDRSGDLDRPGGDPVQPDAGRHHPHHHRYCVGALPVGGASGALSDHLHHRLPDPAGHPARSRWCCRPPTLAAMRRPPDPRAGQPLFALQLRSSTSPPSSSPP